MKSPSVSTIEPVRQIDAGALRTSASTPWRLDHVINGRFLDQPVTGVQRYALETMRALDEILVQSNGRADMLAPRRAKVPDYRSIRVSKLALTSGHVWEQTELPLYARGPILSLCNMGPVAASEQIICIHDANVFHCPESYSPSFRLFYRALLPRLARRAARLVTVSYASRLQLAQLFSIPERDIAVLHNGHQHVFGWRPELSSLAAKVDQFRPFVLMIGSAALHKNNGVVLALAEALDALGVDIAVAGGNASIFAATRYGRAPNVHFLGRVTDDDLACLYMHAICLAFPSRSEGFGLPLLEAMALGCPIVASPIPSSIEVCGDAALFADAGDGESWLRSLGRMAASGDLRSELTGRARARAGSFSWGRSALGYLELARWGRL